MKIKTGLKKILLITVIILAIFECLYLFALPAVLNKAGQTDCLKNLVKNKSNAILSYDRIKFKTHIMPRISISVVNLSVNDKNTGELFLNTDNAFIQFKLLPFLAGKVNASQILINNLQINIKKDKDGNYNFQKIFPSNKNKHLSFSLKKTDLNADKINLSFKDEFLNKSMVLKGGPTVLKTNKNTLSLIFKGNINSENKDISDIDINFVTKFPFSKNVDENLTDGHCLIYNIDLSILQPFIKEYIDKNNTKAEGIIDFLQISAEKQKNKSVEIVINTTFKDVIYDRSDWKNYISAKNTNKINSKIELENKKININTFKYEAENVDIRADGDIDFSEKKPKLNLHTKVINSRAENIASILPPNIVPQYRTIEKVKTYGVFGDIEAEVNVTGKVPQPDITGYVRGRNVHILDKSLHNLHKGTIDINFNKRILNMDILVNLFDGQSAKVKGYVYMFRDGVNHVTVKTTDNIDFPLAQKIIIPVSKVFNFQLGPIPEMNITSGKGIIDLDIKGSIDLIDIHGYSAFDKAQLTYNGLFGQVNDGKGRLDFNGDVITFKSDRAFVKKNPLSIDGKVKINGRLDFNIASNLANAEDVIEIINKSELLKDVKAGMAVITKAFGLVKLTVNIKADIVPVPFGQPPLPPEEAFENMKVKGSLYLLGDSCYIEGFYTPIEKIKGIVDFTEKLVELQYLEGVSGTSPVKIFGQIITDLNTKIPDVDITVTSKSVNLKDTIKFLTKSYLYPKNYPDLSSLYKIASKHDLYFKYKAKSIDFITDNAYAVMNFIPDNSDNPIKAKSGKVTMEKSNVEVENVQAYLFDSILNISGNIKNVDTLNPIYNLKIHTPEFNLCNLNNADKIKILPEQIKNILKQFTDYSGNAKINININKNVLNGDIDFKRFTMKHVKTQMPAQFDDFSILFKKQKILLQNLSAQIEDVPLYANIVIDSVMSKPSFNGYFTSKITNNFIKNYLPQAFSQRVQTIGDINFSTDIKGDINSIHIKPVLTLNPDSDIIFDGANFGETTEKREFTGNVNIDKSQIIINSLNYIKYVTSQNNKTYPITFAVAKGILKYDKNNELYPEEMTLKTNKNLPARILNIFLKTPILKYGSFKCDLKYIRDIKTGAGKLLGNFDCRNIDIPIFDTLVKNIRINANNNKIEMNLLGFISDSKININSILENNITQKPKVKSLNIYAEQFDINNFFESLSKVHKAMNTNNEIKNTDFSNLSIDNGHLELKQLTVKSLTANDIKSNFSIEEKGIFRANNMSISVGNGNISGKLSYNLQNTEFNGDFELNNVDSNYISETLFDGHNQIFGNANGKILLKSKGITNEEIIKNLAGFVYFEVLDGRMPKLGSLEYLLHASNIIKSGITGLTINSILELLNLVKTGYFSMINGSCKIKNGIAEDIEIYSTGENLSLYIHGNYDINTNQADMEILGKLSKKISTIFGTVGNTSLNTFFKLIPGISLLDFGKKDFIENVEKIPPFTGGEYDSRTFQAIINGDINSSNYVQSFKWVK